MAKHFLGFGLFLSLVTVFGLAYWVLSIPPIPSVDRVTPVEESSYPIYGHCDAQIGVGKARAIADRKTGKLTIYVDRSSHIGKYNSSCLNQSFAFFVVRGDEISLLDVVNERLVNVDVDEANWTVRYNADWIKNLSMDANLYIEPSVGDAFKTTHIADPFSKETAIPVLILD
jgi:hypothetical protein